MPSKEPTAPAAAPMFTFDLDKTLVTVMLPVGQTTYSTSAPNPTHVPTTLTLRQLAEALRGAS